MNYSVEYIRKLRKEYGLTTDEIEGFFTEMADIDELESQAEELYEDHYFRPDYYEDLAKVGRI